MLRRRLAAIGVLTLLIAGFAACDPFVVGQRAAVYNVTENKMHWDKNPNDPGWAGSTTKILTLYTALWAVSHGYVSLTDEVAISARAQSQACTCLEAVPNPQNPNWQMSGTVVGERFLFADLLVGIVWSAGEATDAVAEHVAAGFFHNGVPASSVSQSETYMREFLALSNFLAYDQLGATNTWQASVHGGNGCDFAIGCYDDFNNWCAKGAVCGHRTTARDLVVMWKKAAALEPMFMQILGYKSWLIYSKTDPNSEFWNKTYPLMGRGWWYAGWQGDKNGSGGTVAAQATRCGRTIVAVSMNANNDVGVAQEDVVRLFDDAFNYFCNLKAKFKKVSGLMVRSSALAISSGGRIASSSLSEYGTFDVTAWSDSSDAAASAVASIESTPGPVEPGTDPEDLVSSAFLGDGMLATAVVESDLRLRLSSWSLAEPAGAALQLAHVGDFDVPGLHRSVRLLALGPQQLLLATRDEQGYLSLRTFAVDPDAHQLAPLSQSLPADSQPATSFELAASGGVDETGAALPWVVMTAVEDGGQLSVLQWEIQSDGSIASVGGTSAGDASGVSIAATGSPAEGRFATAAVGGSEEVGGLLLQLWRAGAGGPELVRSVDASPYYATLTGDTAIRPIANGGPGSLAVFHRSNATGALKASVWDIPDEGFELGELRIAKTGMPNEPGLGILAASVPGSDDILVASRDSDGVHGIRRWRVGPE